MEINELQHWGIFGMKWGVRRFQNPDGSLTPEGRQRYGVGAARSTKATSVHDIPDDELKKMTNRLYTEKNYLDARNKYIESQNYYNKLTQKPDSLQGVKRFLGKVFGESVTNILQKDVEFALSVSGASILNESGSKYGDKYLDYVLKQYKPKKDKNQNNTNDND